ncbi:uncharacterized protein BJ171DRAFT_503943 [Polychytrium aggregatum]|uniref:uncharacterized protein n=1 Tax=Polychytrium aggregatum TaxID=110093 RepID=UPI0022FF0F74|nr:uncharacterized protein BJ171DRAFT_503943 [Polychytrium aggregatum]KAI9204881.1 hypothetical protein BJ171DRAFT_503943 [Polychytrium aggregatum]
MKFAATTAVVLAAASASVLAQTTCDMVSFNGCLTSVQQFETSTCEPLAPKNQTLYKDCLCYYQSNLKNCYLLCPNDANLTATLQGSVNPAIISACTAAGLPTDGKLPNPAPWVTVTSSSAAPSSTGAPASSSSAAASPAASTKSSAGSMLSGSVFGAVIASLAAIAAM